MVGKILEPEIRSLIDARNFTALREVFREFPPADVAEVILDMPEDEQVIIFRVLPHDLAADVFEYLGIEEQQNLLRAMAHEQVVAILNEMSPDDRTALLEELPSAAARQLIRLLTPEERHVATALLGYPEYSVGRLMTPDFIAAKEDWTVQHVLDYVREYGRDRETLNFIYVVDDRGKLIDDVRMREFLLRPLTAKVSDIRDRNFAALNATDSQQDALNFFRKYDRAALPVVDSNGVLVGIVTSDDMLDVAEEEATEDIQKLGGLEALDEPYTTIPFLRMVKKRATWLIILFLGEMLTATAMQGYNSEIERAAILAMFLPLIISSGGNSGSQATTLVIRAMALGELRLGDWFRVVRKELLSGLALGLILGVIGFFRISLWQYLHIFDYGKYHWLVALTVGSALVGVVLWGTLSGAMLPFLLRRCGLDPAASSAPFVATLVDVTGLVIYFNVALFVLRGTLL
jgi:magnesium transporter